MVPTSLPPASTPDPGSAPWTRLVGDAGDDPAVRAEDYQDIVALAARLADAPIAILAVRDGDGLRVLARHGLHTAAAVIADSHLLHAIGSSRPLLSVADTQQDIRFCDDVLVRAAPGIRFHLGVALHGGNGQCVGVLAVCDTQPRRRGPDAAAAHLGRVSRLAVGLLERHQLQRRSHISTQIMQADFSAVVVVDGSGHVVFVNRAAQAMFGSGARAMRGIPVEVLFPPHLQSDAEAAERWLHAAPSADAVPSAQQLRIADASGSTRTLQAARCVWQVGDGHGVALILRDVTDQIEQHQRLQQAALHDALTGVPNRNALVDSLGALLRDEAAALGVALLNLDNFKAINDTLGHATGDTVLQVTAGRLQAALPDGALLARLGGDEFAMVYPHIAVDALGDCLERLLASVSQPCYIDGHVIHMDASIGYTLRDPAEERDALDSSDLIARADLALYKAKAAGGRQLCRFDPKMRQEAIERRRLDLELRRAHADGEFELHYQPQIDLDGGRITGAEALLRWRHPERGLLPPIDFIDALSKSPIASSVGRWIVRRGCEDAARWPRVDGREMTISINLFAVQVNDGQLHSVVQHALHDSGLAPERLELEITESIALRPDDTAARMLGRVRACGVKLAFDDFGTGHASLSILQRFPIDRVKIDRSFVRDMIGNRGDAAIVRSIVLISQNLDLDVVAEGVENDHQADMLRGFGCRGAQGFLYSKALEPHAFERWLCDQSGAGAATEAALRLTRVAERAAPRRAAATVEDERTFEFDDRDFRRVSRLIHDRAGIHLAPHKRDMVYSRLARRLRSRGLSRFRDYLDALEADDGPEWQAFVNALTTNLTSFFREAHHFDSLAALLQARARAHGGVQTIWCAAASTGEEAYSLAITACEAFATPAPPVRIVATDIDTQVLQTAARGVYPLDRIASLSAQRRQAFFQRGSGPHAGQCRVRPSLQALVEFRPLNLLAAHYDVGGEFAAVFCRNVMIYFDKPTQYQVLSRIAPLLAADGVLFAGHSESFTHAQALVAPCGRTMYRAVADRHAR